MWSELIVKQAFWFTTVMIILIIYRWVLDEMIISEKTRPRINKIYFTIVFVSLTMVWLIRYNSIYLIMLNVGVFLNMVVIVSNNGYMPVDMDAFKKSLSLNGMVFISDEETWKEFKRIQASRHRHIAMDKNTKFKFLGDKYGPSIRSVGDYFIYLGYRIMPIEFIAHVFRLLFLS